MGASSVVAAVDDAAGGPGGVGAALLTLPTAGAGAFVGPARAADGGRGFAGPAAGAAEVAGAAFPAGAPVFCAGAAATEADTERNSAGATRKRRNVVTLTSDATTFYF